MKKRLAINGLIKMFSGIAIIGLLLFISAGTINYAGAWRMIFVLFIPMLILGIVLLLLKPDLLAKRLNNKEKEKDQKNVISLSALVFISSFIICGLDFRFSITAVPIFLSILASIIFIFTYILFAELLRENEYLSRTVEVFEGQKVVSTGLYGIVRHPMYAVIFWMFISMPVIIGSFLGLIPMALIPYILVKRILNEEKVLKENLDGYNEYTQKVKFRLIPFIW